MNIPLILGKIIGLNLFLISLCLLINKKTFRIFLRLMKSKEFNLISAFLFIFLGSVIISLHNVWSLNWEGFITIIGWLFIFEGLFRFFFIDLIKKIMKDKDSEIAIKLSLYITLFIGIYLIIVTF